MTYCLAIKINEGLVFCTDSRTNAGADQVSTFSKMHRFCLEGDRHLVLLSSGNLATTQTVIDEIHRDLREAARITINNAQYLADVADYVGQVSVAVQNKYAPAGEEAGFNAGASFILGGQIRGERPEIYLIYPQGNHIHASSRHPFFQIGETKYGKPILDRIIKPKTTREIAMRCALVSMDSTLRSNATVGPPVELMFLSSDDLSGGCLYRSFDRSDDYLLKLRGAWNEEVVRAFNNLPELMGVFEGD